MLYLWYLSAIGGKLKGYAPESPVFRATLAVLLAFFVVWALGPFVIRTLVRLKIGDLPQFDHEALNRATKDKTNTPTMGGVLIAVAILVTVLLLANIRNFYIILGLFCLVWLAALGGVDDWLKLTFKRRGGSRDGLYMWEKLIFQVALGVLLALFIYRYGEANLLDARWGQDLEAPYRPNYNVVDIFNIPFYKHPLALSTSAFVLIAIVVIAGTSNAVNLTDGMDGLASGCMVLTAFAFMVFAYVVGTKDVADKLLFPYIFRADELAVLCGAVVGGCLGFMWYNAYPAQVFMGDTGSLPLGGLMGYVAIVTRQEPMLLIVGGVFVIEALSVLLQVGYYKATHGKRIFRCAPLHHHYHLGGLNETQVVMRFWLLAALFAAFALLTIKLR
jgi:phospho-N-acetylmuramoyl-pentapeptide-transferase